MWCPGPHVVFFGVQEVSEFSLAVKVPSSAASHGTQVLSRSALPLYAMWRPAAHSVGAHGHITHPSRAPGWGQRLAVEQPGFG